MTKIEGTGDEEADKALKAAALEVALEYKAAEKKAMTRLRKAAQALRDELGDESPEYIEANNKYYKQKAIYEQIEKILANTNSAGAAA